LPVLFMQGVVGPGAIVRFEQHRDCAVVRHGQFVDQLLEIGTMILAIASCQLHGATPLIDVGTGQLDRGRVLVNLTQVDRIGLDGVQHYAGQQTGAICFEEPVQRTGQHVIAVSAAVNQSRVVWGGPLSNSIQGIAFDQNVLQQQKNSLGVAYLSHGLGEVLQKLDSLNGVIENGKGAQVLPYKPKVRSLHNSISYY